MPPIRLLPRCTAGAAMVAVALLLAPATGGAEPLKLTQFTTSGPLKKAPGTRRAKSTNRSQAALDARAQESPAATKKTSRRKSSRSHKAAAAHDAAAHHETAEAGPPTSLGKHAATGGDASANAEAFNALDAAAPPEPAPATAETGSNDVPVVSADTFNELDQAAAEPVTTGTGAGTDFNAPHAEPLIAAPAPAMPAGTSWIGVLFLGLGGSLAAGSAAYLMFRRRTQNA